MVSKGLTIAVLILVFGGTPARAAPPITIAPIAHEPTAQELAQLYTTVGRELSALEAKSPYEAIDLWPRFRWIRINDALVYAQKRHDTYLLLERLRRDVAITSAATQR